MTFYRTTGPVTFTNGDDSGPIILPGALVKLTDAEAAALGSKVVAAPLQPTLKTAAEWASLNPIPAQGEKVYESDTGKWKTGDGTTHYNDLPYDDDSTAAHIRGHELFQKFTKRPDSASIPNIFDSGQKGGTIAGGTNAQQYVSGGRLRSTPTGGGAAAGYYTAALSANATRIGARWVFIPHSTNGGTMAIAVTQTQYTTQGSAPALGIHFVITPLAWAVGYSTTTNGAITNVLTGTFATPLTQDSVTEYWAEAVLVGTTLYLRLPDGTVTSTSWTTGASHCGPGVFFEHFANVGNTDNEVAYIEVWADSGRQRPLVADAFVPWRKVYAASGTTSTAVAAGTAVTIPGITSGAITAPASGKLLVRQRWYMVLPSTTDILAACAIDGASSSSAAQYIAKGVSGDREIAAEFLFTGLTPGGAYIVTPKVLTSAASTIYTNTSSGYNAMLVVVPVS